MTGNNRYLVGTVHDMNMASRNNIRNNNEFTEANVREVTELKLRFL